MIMNDDVNKDKQIFAGGDVIGVNVKAGRNVNINKNGIIDVHNTEFNQTNQIFSESLSTFSKMSNTMLEEEKISNENRIVIQKSLNELATELKSISPDDVLNESKKNGIKQKIHGLATRLWKTMPNITKVVNLLETLTPIYNLIGESTENILKVIL